MIGKALLAASLGLAVISVRPAAAQVTFGSPNDPPRIALEGGAFDVIQSSTHPDSRTAALLGSEYRFGDKLWILSPFVGLSGTSDGAFYGYFGFGIDVNFGNNWVLTPNGAAGYFYRGGGTNLGSWWEFRTGVELDYRLPNQDRIGVAFHHTSNAGLTQRNPGEESALIVYTVPVP